MFFWVKDQWVLIYMRYKIETSLKKTILDVSKYVQFIYNDRWLQRLNILPVFLSFYNLLYLSKIFLQLVSHFYNLLVIFITYFNTLIQVNRTSSAYFYHFLKIVNIMRLSVFISLSACIFLVKIYKILIFFCSTFSQMKCQYNLIYFVFKWTLEFFINEIISLLSVYKSKS